MGVSGTPSGDAHPEDARPGPMTGIRVIDLSRVLAGPTVGRLFAEMGAEVIKVESPGGDSSRRLPHVKNGRSAYYVQQNRGKESVCLDLRQQSGHDTLVALLERSDVLIENFRPGVLAEMGFAWDVLRQINPRLILCSVSALGQEGPLARRPGYDTVGAAYSGLASLSGAADGPPIMPTSAIGDVTTGVHGFAGVAAALFNRERTGCGDWVQVSLLDSYFHCQEISIQSLSASGGEYEPVATGSRHPSVVPSGTYPCAGSYVFIACVGPADWGRLCDAMGHPELAVDDRYRTNEDRARQAAEVHGLIEDWLASIGDVHEAVELLAEREVAAAPILSVAEAVRHPHNLARRSIREIHDDRIGSITVPGLPIRFANHPEERDLRARELGEDGRIVLQRVLGWDETAIERLVASGVLHEATTQPEETR